MRACGNDADQPYRGGVPRLSRKMQMTSEASENGDGGCSRPPTARTSTLSGTFSAWKPVGGKEVIVFCSARMLRRGRKIV